MSECANNCNRSISLRSETHKIAGSRRRGQILLLRYRTPCLGRRLSVSLQSCARLINWTYTLKPIHATYKSRAVSTNYQAYKLPITRTNVPTEGSKPTQWTFLRQRASHATFLSISGQIKTARKSFCFGLWLGSNISGTTTDMTYRQCQP